MTTIEKITYCRICEPLCGLVATVEDGRITGVRGDKENPLSKGFQCVKSEAMVDVVYDPDLSPGNIALPHGWGHDGGWQRANRAGGSNSNLLASSEDKSIERLAGMSVLNGIPVRVEPASVEATI